MAKFKGMTLIPCWLNTTLHNSMILSTASIKSHDFALGFPKRSHTNRDSII